MFIHFDTIHERDRHTHTHTQTDRQTPHDGIGRPTHSIARQKFNIYKQLGSTVWYTNISMNWIEDKHIASTVDIGRSFNKLTTYHCFCRLHMLVTLPAWLSQQSADDVECRRQMSGAGSHQGTSALFHEDSGRPERTAGM